MPTLTEETTGDYRTREDVGALVVRALVFALGLIADIEAERGAFPRQAQAPRQSAGDPGRRKNWGQTPSPGLCPAPPLAPDPRPSYTSSRGC